MCSTSVLPNHLSLVIPTKQGGRGKGESFALLSSSSSLPIPSISAIRLPISSSFGSKPTNILHRLRKPSQSTTAANSTSEETDAASAATAVEEEEEVAEEEEEVAKEEEAKPLRKPIIKLGDIMGILNKRAVEAAEKERPVPDIRSGDVVQIKLEVPENRRRASIYKGIVISKQNAGIHTTIRIRRIIAGIGVEIVFPVYSPNIKELKVVSHRKVRRARLYYLRDKLPRLSTFK